MRNYIYFKIVKSNGRIFLAEKVISEDLSSRISWGKITMSSSLSVIIQNDNIRLIADSFNSLPLFWGEDDEGSIIISNRHDKVAQDVNVLGVDVVGYWELFLFETPLRSRTLFKGISVTQSGHELIIDSSGVITNRYFDFAFGRQEYSKNLVAEAHELLKAQLKSVPSNIIFPISGGLDSRLLLSYMKGSVTNQSKFVTYGFSTKILENIYAKDVLHRTCGYNHEHQFHTLKSDNYLESGISGAIMTGALAGIQNSHLLGYARTAPNDNVTCILGMYADAIFGYGYSSKVTDWKNCSYAMKAIRFHEKGVFSKIILDDIISDLEIIYNEWFNISDITSFEEYIYIRERNGKFHNSLINTLQCHWNVLSPFNNWELIKFFMSLPNELRENKLIVREVLKDYFPEVASVGDVSSSFRYSKERKFHDMITFVNNVFSRKLRLPPIFPVYTDTERHDYSFLKFYRAEFNKAISDMESKLNLSDLSIKSLSKMGSGMHAFQFISNATVVKSVLGERNER